VDPEGGRVISLRLRIGLIGLVVGLSSIGAGTAQAAWDGAGHGSANARGDSLSAVGQPSASADGRSVTVDWSGPSSGAPATGFVVERLDGSGDPQAVGGDCAGTVTQTECTETGVPPGTWTYRVTPANADWRGDASPASEPVTVAAPTLTLDRSSVAALPATITGRISNFGAGQTVSLRLDGPNGPALTGGISPSPVPASGAADVTVTLPAGTAAGQHAIYAVGDAGDEANAQVTVLASHAVTTSAWDLRDASAGGTELNASDPSAFSADGRTMTTTPPPATFRANRYLQIDFNGPVPASAITSSASFDFRFAAGRAGSTACFYFDVRRASTNAVIATHGSAAAPVGCVTGTGQSAFSTALSEVSTGTVASDLRLRVYMRATGSVAPAVDLATVRLTGPLGTATLYDVDLGDRLGGATVDAGWPLAAQGGNVYRSASLWSPAFSASRYLRLTAPSYVPAGATVTGASFVHRFRRVSGGTVCWYLQVLQGTTVIGTHGSPASPISCTSGGGYRTDTVSLPEINSPARANGTVLKLYVRSSTGRASEHDLAELSINYAN